MAAPKNPSNGTKQIEKRLALQGKGELCPPDIGSGTVEQPKELKTMGDIINEQMRLYKLVFAGKLAITDYTKLMYGLQHIIQGFKAKSEMDALEDAYIKQWRGVEIIAPQAEVEKDPMDLVIEAEVVDG